MAQVLGSDSLRRFLRKYGLELDPAHEKVLMGLRRRPLASFVTPENRTVASDAALDFLDRLLRFDLRSRMTAAEALAHPYLAGV